MAKKDYQSDSVVSIVSTIQPAEAKEMLATSPGNRYVRKWWVALLARIILAGEFRSTHQGIAFDSLGRLRDGHHRLMACVAANRPITVMITMGLPPSSFDVIDQGVFRSTADVLGLDGRVAHTLRLGASFFFGTSRVTIAQTRVVAGSGLLDAIVALNDHCGVVRRYATSAPMRLAAAVSVLDKPDSAIYVFEQYRAMATLDYQTMSRVVQALVRQADSGRVRAADSRDTFARGVTVFEESNRDLSKVQVSVDTVVHLQAWYRGVIDEKLATSAA